MLINKFESTNIVSCAECAGSGVRASTRNELKRTFCRYNFVH